LYQLNQPCGFSLFFGSVRLISPQLASSPPFPLTGVTSPPTDVVTLSRRVTLPFHWAKMSSLSPLYLPATLCSVASLLEPKLKHWIYTTAARYPPWIVRLSPSTAIKRPSQYWSLFIPLNHVSILPPLQLEHHAIGASPVVVVPFPRHLRPIVPPHNNTHSDDLADPSFTSRTTFRYVNLRKKIF
jgi:hypothetical protein